MTFKKNEPIAWIDLLRIIACFLVLISHSTDPFTAQFDTNPNEFFTAVFMGSSVRSCVPLFVMISGVLLLPVRLDMNEFYKRRAKRILIPLIVWSLVMPVAYYFYLNYGTATTNPGIDMANHTLDASLTKMYTFIFNFNYDITPLWYLYMLIGLYLILPILGAWIDKASKKEMKTFLVIWLITTMLPYLQILAPMLGYTGNYGNMGLLGVCDWNPYGTFYYFSGFLGYMVLAHYLVKYPLQWSTAKTWSIAIPCFLIGYVITSIGFLTMQKYYPGNYQFLEIPWYFSGFNVLLMTVSIFIVAQRVKIKSTPVLRKIASLTFGVYLIHFIIVQMGYDLIYNNVLIAPVLQILLIALFAFVVSLGISYLLSLNKYTRKSIM